VSPPHGVEEEKKKKKSKKLNWAPRDNVMAVVFVIIRLKLFAFLQRAKKNCSRKEGDFPSLLLLNRCCPKLSQSSLLLCPYSL
jgi:hypothetical protein